MPLSLFSFTLSPHRCHSFQSTTSPRSFSLRFSPYFHSLQESSKMHFTTVAASSAILALASASLNKRSLSGQATYYGGNVAGGACSFSTYTLPSGIFGTALSDSNWDTSANCGACVSVTGPSGNSITAMVNILSSRSYITNTTRLSMNVQDVAQTTSIYSLMLSLLWPIQPLGSLTSPGTTLTAPSPQLSKSTTKRA